MCKILLVPIIVILLTLFTILYFVLFVDTSSDIEIRFSGQITGEFEAKGGIGCVDRKKVPFLSFLTTEKDNYDQVVIDLVPGITTGNYQFTNENIEGDGIRFTGFLYAENNLLLRPEDLISGELILTQLPNRERGWVEGEFNVVYPDMTVEGTFKFRADPNDAPFDCIN